MSAPIRWLPAMTSAAPASRPLRHRSVPTASIVSSPASVRASEREGSPQGGIAMKSDRPGRPPGSRNTKPSEAAVAAYYKLLAQAADQGDTNAAGWLVYITEQQRKR